MNNILSITKAIEMLKDGKSGKGRLKLFPFEFGISEVVDIIKKPTIRASQVRVVVNGEVIDKSRYIKSAFLGRSTIHDAVDDAKLLRLISNGATIAIDSMEYLFPEVESVCKAFEESFGLQSTATSYITPPNGSGFFPHTDEEEILVVQMQGKKYWRYAPPMGGIVYSEVVRDKLLNGGSKVTLGKGDFLCLPSGTPHAAYTKDFFSVHITFSVEKKRLADIIKDYISYEREERSSRLNVQVFVQIV